ncbi:endoribonuclease L-PSP [Fusarium oxysporum f. sp. lycopersici 4287]|uniref:Endoribonuclease L-PSP n=1 Tax=Fusarium oxysporum f. sp. lycopersici (strain 4287 / CBS 123668 / FGSC 9935 / NRRL 34936) TaxID=426428 RepID=A0A0J9VNA6_FUSO4|nr:endoribonuclease L-PSP [Fusarium oxysporum f. sp. lycopersici 4287]KNB12448.1 endoribonuclease L-PSP [Fusarium oxysporum f. sp. lycopersici 4287]
MDGKMSSDQTTVSTSQGCPAIGPYSQAVIAGPYVFLSGQIPIDSTGKPLEGSIADKTHACCKSVQAVLSAAGSDISRVAKVTVFLDDMKNFAEFNAVYETYFTHKPARSCVAVKTLPKNLEVEIECVALMNTNEPRL